MYVRMAPNNVHMKNTSHTFMIVTLHTTKQDMIPVEHYISSVRKACHKLLGQVQQFKAIFGELHINLKWTIMIL